MADNYTQFSVMLPVPEPEKASQFFLKWEDETKAAREDEDEYHDRYCGFDHFLVPSTGVWVRSSGDTGNVEAAVGFIQSYLKELGIEKAVYMSWANTCSKLRANEFSGGGVVITSDALYWSVSEDAIHNAAKAGVDVRHL